MNRVLIGLLTAYSVVFAVLEVLYLPVYVGSIAVPAGAFGAAVSNVALTQAAGWFSTRTAVVAAPVLAWLVTVLILASGGPGGDVLVPGDWKALALFMLGLAPAGILLGRHMSRSALQRAVSGR